VNVLNQKVLRDPSVLNCKEVSRIVASDELETLGVVKRLRTRFHLFICRACGRYADQVRIIGAAARDRVRRLGGDKESLQRLEQSILDDAFGAPREKH
jgi:hypothetical protein